ERCLPVDHTDRNSLMAECAWLNHVAIPREQIFNIPAELDPKVAAKQYEEIIKNTLPFDMVLLGMGEDGHTASLFPNHRHDETELVHAIFNSPKPPPERVSLSVKALSDTKALLFLITGENKREAVQAWRAGDALPVARIEPKQPIDVYIDKVAQPTTF
ncbi:partial 6-phosphogluconolactonase, partial [uncultured bacterium]